MGDELVAGLQAIIFVFLVTFVVGLGFQNETTGPSGFANLQFGGDQREVSKIEASTRLLQATAPKADEDLRW